jgi:Catalase
MRHRPFFPMLALLLAATGCSSSPLQQDTAPANAANPVESAALSYPEADPVLGESLYPDEKVIAGQIAATIEKAIRTQYQPGHARRDAHPKAHGCVKAELHVAPSLPDNLRKGMFIPGKTYQAWIRFSNGSQDPTKADEQNDARGMAIKVMGVPGQKLLENEASATTQDFIMINHPVFFANEPQKYLSFLEKVNSDSYFSKLTLPFSLGAKGSLIAWQTIHSKIANPLYARYWSMVPYQLGTGEGRQAVKFSAKSCSPAAAPPIPDKPEHDYLRAALRTTLENGDGCMELMVQPRTSDNMSVEDAMTEWDEKDAPFHTVATITIPRQQFDTPEQNQFCENLSFTPWHALPEHRPLGAVNRLRKVIYDHISRVRHEMNATARQEP